MAEVETDLNGVAHIILTVSDWEKSSVFYRKLGNYLGLTCVMDDANSGYSQGDGPFLYFVGGRTALGIMQAKDPYKDEKFRQWRAGLHHVCFRLKSVDAIHRIHEFLVSVAPQCELKIIQAPKEGPWAPGYTSVLFEDRDGIRLEFNYVPGKGLLGTKDKTVFAKL